MKYLVITLLAASVLSGCDAQVDAPAINLTTAQQEPSPGPSQSPTATVCPSDMMMTTYDDNTAASGIRSVCIDKLINDTSTFSSGLNGPMTYSTAYGRCSVKNKKLCDAITIVQAWKDGDLLSSKHLWTYAGKLNVNSQIEGQIFFSFDGTLTINTIDWAYQDHENFYCCDK